MPLDTSHFFDDIYLIITKDQLNILRNFYYATTGLSIFGSLFIIFTYLINKNLRNFSFSLIFYMTLSVLFQDISKLLSIWLPLEEINDPHDHRLCMVQAYLLNYSQVSTLIWCTIISWVLYGTVYLVRKNITIDIERFLLIGFGYPICISLIPLYSDDYGKYELGCWIASKEANSLRGTIIRNICYYIPLLLAVIFNLYWIHKVTNYVSNTLPNDPSLELLKRLKLYPRVLLLILCCFIAKVLVVFITDNETANFVVLIITTFFVNILGVYNFLIFGFTKSVKDILHSQWIFFKRKCCCYNTERSESSDSGNGSGSYINNSRLPYYDINEDIRNND